MKHEKWLTGPLAMVLPLVLVSVAVAQPDPNNAPKGDNPPARGNGGGGRNMTPEQRQQMMLEMQTRMQEQIIRRSLDQVGTAKPQQDLVVAFAKQQDQALTPLQEKARKLVTAISTAGETDDNIATLLKEFQDAVATAKENRKTAREALDAQINYSKQPRLAGVLTALGVVSDDVALLSGGGPGAFGGAFNVFGGGFGGAAPGGRGGRGGRGGNPPAGNAPAAGNAVPA